MFSPSLKLLAGVGLVLLCAACTTPPTPTATPSFTAGPLSPTPAPPTAILSATSTLPPSTAVASPTAAPSTDLPGGVSSPTPTPVPMRADAAGKIYLGQTLLVDTAQEAPNCTRGELSYSPTGQHMLLTLQCFAEYGVAFLFRADGSGKRAVTADKEYVTGYYFSQSQPFYQWSPDGQWLLYTRTYVEPGEAAPVPIANMPNGLVLYNTQTGAKVLLPAASEVITGMLCSTTEIVHAPGARYFAVVFGCFEGDGRILVYRADGAEEQWVTGANNDWLSSNHLYTWAPDGQRLVYHRGLGCCLMLPDASPDGLVLYDVPTRQKKFLFSVSFSQLPLSWSPDGQWLAYTDYGGITTTTTGNFHSGLVLYLVNNDGTRRWGLEVSLEGTPEESTLWWEQPDLTAPPILHYEPAVDAPHSYTILAEVLPTTNMEELGPPLPSAALYRVTQVASNDVLNVRAAPGAEQVLAGTIPADGVDVQVTGLGQELGTEFWVPIQHADLQGWVNSFYLASQTHPPLNEPTFQSDFEITPEPTSTALAAPRLTLAGPGFGAEQVAFNADGSLVAVGAVNNVWVWQTRTGRKLHYLRQGLQGGQHLAFSPGSSVLAASGSDVRVWNMATGEWLYTFNQRTTILDIAFGADGHLLAATLPISVASAADAQTVEIWDLTTNTLRHRLVQETRVFALDPASFPYAVLQVALSPDGSRLVVGYRNLVEIWDTETGQRAQRLDLTERYNLEALRFSSDGAKLITSLTARPENPANDKISVWDVATLQKLGEVVTPAYLQAMALSQDGRWLAVSHNTQEIAEVTRWAVATGARVDAWPVAPYSFITALTFSPDGRTLAVALREEGDVLLWDVPQP